jgi:hypothetical protein
MGYPVLPAWHGIQAIGRKRVSDPAPLRACVPGSDGARAGAELVFRPRSVAMARVTAAVGSGVARPRVRRGPADNHAMAPHDVVGLLAILQRSSWGPDTRMLGLGLRVG